MNIIRAAIHHFISFHKGTVNIILHLIGFTLIGLAIYQKQWGVFALGLVTVEFGHIYNHIMKIVPYDTRFFVIFWRITSFCAVLLLWWFIIPYL